MWKMIALSASFTEYLPKWAMLPCDALAAVAEGHERGHRQAVSASN
jgi:hypothetical protein